MNNKNFENVEKCWCGKKDCLNHLQHERWTKKICLLLYWRFFPQLQQVGSGSRSQRSGGVLDVRMTMNQSEETVSYVARQNRLVIYFCFLELVHRVPTRPGKPGKMRVHLENLEISWNFEKKKSWKNGMKPGKTWWLLKIHPWLPWNYTKFTKLLK